MGTPEFSATVLRGLLEDPQYTVIAVVTQPDRAVGRKKEIKITPVKEVALEYHLPLFQPEKLSASQELDHLIALGADGIITAAFGQFLPEKLLHSVPFALNVHASLLPKYRGGAPIHYALIKGEQKTGITIMEMVKQMDAGDMVAQSSIMITKEDNVGTLFVKLAALGRDLLLETLPAYMRGEIIPQAQAESEASFSPNITAAEEKINWNLSAEEIFNHIRGMNPWPAAHTLWEGKRFKIYEAQEVPGNGQPGQIIDKTKEKLVVAAGQEALSLQLIQPWGKPKMSVKDFLNGSGRKLEVGDFFGE